MREIRKYPRTTHVQGSRFQHGDHDLEAVPWKELAGKHLVIEEKMDGSNFGVSFDDDGNLLLQSRGHYLRGGHREKQFAKVKSWANENVDKLFDVLSNRYVMYGENMYCKHSYFYDALPHYFMEFDVLDLETNEFLSTPRRRELLGDAVTSVLVLHEGTVASFDQLASFVGPSRFVTSSRNLRLEESARRAGANVEQVFRETDLDVNMEGLYIKVEDKDRVIGRHKFVRSSFTSKILDSGTHWHDRTIVPNLLKDNDEPDSLGH